MPEPKRPLKVFLCHAHADRDAVKALYNRLTKDGMDAWLDKEKLLPGHDWELEIRKAVREADVVVVCLSKQFNRAGFRQKEVRWVLDTALEQPEGEIFIIPARLEECDTLESLRKWHWVDLFEKDGYERLLRALHMRAEQIEREKGKREFPERHAEEKVEYESVESVTLENDLIKKAEGRYTQAKAIIEAEERGASNKVAREIGGKILREGIQQAGRRDAIKKFFSRSVSFMRFISILGVVVALFWFGSLVVQKIISFLPTSNATSTQQPVAQVAFTSSSAVPTKTIKSTSTPIIIPTMTLTHLPTSTPNHPTPTLGIGSTMIGKDNMTLLYVSAGEFPMGIDAGTHKVTLDAFWIDKTLVTNKMYALCVSTGACEGLNNITSNTRSSYYGNSEYDNYPVIHVDWNMARAYCEWAGRRLPSEAEWEKAARGTDGRTYPWGNSAPNSNLANYDKSVGDTTEVYKYPNGASPYGALDMAGNVWEWVADWYSSTYYANSPLSNPLGPDSGQSRGLRGGSWLFRSGSLRSALRYSVEPSLRYYDIGFRCAQNANP